MAKKCFATLSPVAAVLSEGAAFVATSAVVMDSGTGIVVPEQFPDGNYQRALPISYASTLATMRAAAQADIAEVYGFTPTFVWLDDKGLL